VALIGLDGFEALEQEQPDLEVYRDPASLLVSENSDSTDIERRTEAMIKSRSWERPAIALSYVPRVVQDHGPNLFEISVVSLTPTCESRGICETSTCTVSL
jgi:hypothetical protein